SYFSLGAIVAVGERICLLEPRKGLDDVAETWAAAWDEESVQVRDPAESAGRLGFSCVTADAAVPARAHACACLDRQQANRRGIEMIGDHRHIPADELEPLGPQRLGPFGLHPFRLLRGIPTRARVPPV